MPQRYIFGGIGIKGNALKLFLLSVCLLFVMGLYGCLFEQSPAKQLSQRLFDSYSADVSFVAHNKTNNTQTAGTAHVEKGQKLVVDILSPSEFEGITLESEAFDQNESLSLVYSGIKTQLDSSIFSKIDLALSLASNSLAQKADNCKKDSVSKYNGSFELFGINKPDPYIATINEQDVIYTIVFDKQSGTPFVMKAENQSFSITVKTQKIKYTENT